MQVRHAVLKAEALLLMLQFSAGAWAQQPVTGYVPVNGLKMYYTTHVTLMQKVAIIAPMIEDFLEANPAKSAE